MLVMTRKVGECIVIGDNVVVTVVRLAGGMVRLGIEAPSDYSVMREELLRGAGDVVRGKDKSSVEADVATRAPSATPAAPSAAPAASPDLPASGRRESSGPSADAASE